MKRVFQVLLSTIALAVPAFADEAPKPATPPRKSSPPPSAASLDALAPAYTDQATKPVAKPAETVPSTDTNKHETAAGTAAGSTTSPATAASASAEETSTTASENSDKPRNTIYRLPTFVVQEPKAPDFKPREILTPKEKIALSYKKNPGLHFGNLPFFSNDGIAYAMQQEDERLERIKEMQDQLDLMRYGSDAAAYKRTKDAVIDAINHSR